jgi:hypothetical protein
VKIGQRLEGGGHKPRITQKRKLEETRKDFPVAAAAEGAQSCRLSPNSPHSCLSFPSARITGQVCTTTPGLLVTLGGRSLLRHSPRKPMSGLTPCTDTGDHVPCLRVRLPLPAPCGGWNRLSQQGRSLCGRGGVVLGQHYLASPRTWSSLSFLSGIWGTKHCPGDPTVEEIRGGRGLMALREDDSLFCTVPAVQ